MSMKLPRNLHKTGIAALGSGDHLDLYIFGVIGDWLDGNTANDVLFKLNSSPDIKTIDVYIASVGGYFEDGLPIFNLLKMHSAFVTVNIIGYALSMASHIMLAANKVRIAQNGQIMIHNAQGWSNGDYRDMGKSADILKLHSASLIPEYQRRMKLPPDEIQTLMDNETWYDANAALAAGLVDEIIDPVDASSIDNSQPSNAWQFAARNFKHPPADFQARVESVARRNNGGWVQNLLIRVVGQPSAQLPTNDDEDDMKPEDIAEIKALLECERAATAAMIDEKLAAFNKTADTEPTPEKLPEVVALEKQLADANAKNAELAGSVERMQAFFNEKLAAETPPINNKPAGEYRYTH